MKRKLVYGAIYVSVLFAVPSLPMQGLVFVGGIIRGVGAGLASIDIDWWGMSKDFFKGLLFG